MSSLVKSITTPDLSILWLDFCVSCSHQARHTLISSFPTVESLCWVSGLKGLCHDRPLSLEGFWSAQAPVRLNPLPQMPGFPCCWRSKWKLHLLCFIYFRMKLFLTRVAFHLERWSTAIMQVVYRQRGKALHIFDPCALSIGNIPGSVQRL